MTRSRRYTVHPVVSITSSWWPAAAGAAIVVLLAAVLFLACGAPLEPPAGGGADGPAPVTGLAGPRPRVSAAASPLIDPAPSLGTLAAPVPARLAVAGPRPAGCELFVTPTQDGGVKDSHLSMRAAVPLNVSVEEWDHVFGRPESRNLLTGEVTPAIEPAPYRDLLIEGWRTQPWAECWYVVGVRRLDGPGPYAPQGALVPEPLFVTRLWPHDDGRVRWRWARPPGGWPAGLTTIHQLIFVKPGPLRVLAPSAARWVVAP